MMRFTKMHGLGNDYIYIDCMDGSFGGVDSSILNDNERIAEISCLLSNRHCGIGGDGIILILPSTVADFRMRMFNADGSEGKMCGNATRCIGKYVFDHNYTQKRDITLETLSGVKYLHLHTGYDGKVGTVTVDMGEPEFTPSRIPVAVEDNAGNVDIKISVGGREMSLTAVSMGNPHGVIFVDDPLTFDVHGIGRRLEADAIWPDRANIEFASVTGPEDVVMRVWERGSGETMACGTGACATAVAAMLTGRVHGSKVTVHLLGGDLSVEWNRTTNRVLMSGPATEVFSGEVAI